MERHLQAPISKEELKTLKSGDYVYITGTIYTARDAAHKRMYETLQNQENLPIDIQNQIIYYMGPSPAREGRPIGSAGPTTASRMDKYTPQLLDLGMGAMIGKGKRTQDVIDAVIRNGAVYFAAVGGAGALLSKCITKSEVVAYDDLGTYMIDREDIRQSMQVIIDVSKEVQNGKNYLIFAEGTRSKNGNQIGSFKGGSFKAATKAKCPIVPVALIDSFKPFDTKTISQVTVQVHFLEPLYYEEYKNMKTTEIAEIVHDRIQKIIDENCPERAEIQ